MIDPRWLPAREAADYVGVPASAFSRLVKSGVLPKPRVFNRRKSWSVMEIDAEMSASMPVAAPYRRPQRNIPIPTELLSAESIITSAVPLQPHGSGIYFLIKKGVIVYVGQSVNVPARIATHVAEKAFDSWHWVPCPRKALDHWERLYLNALLPPLNLDQETRRVARATLRSRRV